MDAWFRLVIMSATVPVDQIIVEARRVRPSQVLLIIVLGFFWGIGWIAGRFVVGLVICAVSVRRGWRDGYGYEPAQPPVPQSR